MATNGKSPASNLKSNGKDVSVQDLSEQIQILKSDIAGLTETLGEFATVKSSEVKETAKQKASDIAAAGRDKAVETQLHAEEFIKTQPATALGIAAGVGFLVGMMTARR